MPASLHEAVLWHEHEAAGHFEARKLFATVQRDYSWPRASSRELLRVSAQCAACVRLRLARVPPLVGDVERLGAPARFERIEADVLSLSGMLF